MTTPSVDESGIANPFLAGNFGPVDLETTALDLRVTGVLPSDLDGHLLRSGPNPIDPGDSQHWFTGDGMLHAIEIADGCARSYRNRWIRTGRVEELRGLQAAPVSPVVPFAQGSGAVHVIDHAGRLLALSEIGLPFEVDRQLETLRMYDFGEALASNMTAHPKIDPRTGELFFFGYDFTDVHLRYHRADADGRLERTLEIATPRPTMMHDFGVTASRVVFMEFPVVFTPELLEQGRGLPYAWNDGIPARLGILPRDATRDVTRWIEFDPCFVFHVLNTYDEDASGTGRIVMDVIQHEKTFMGGDLDAEKQFRRPRLVRWTIDPEAGTLGEQVIEERAPEFPRVSPRVECGRHGYGYATTLTFREEREVEYSSLMKFDLERGVTLEHPAGPGRAAGEGVFVPRPGGQEEDDGYLLSVVYDAASHRSDVIVVDCRDFEAPPVATIHLPVRVPFGFHGSFAPRA